MGDAPPGSTQQTSRSQPESAAEESAAYLVRALECEDPLEGAFRYALGGVTEVRIGRGERSHRRAPDGRNVVLRISVPDRKMSGDHARLVRAGDAWVLEDLDSTNGSAVSGSRVERASLSSGDVIELGGTVFLFRETAGASRPITDKGVRVGGGDDLATLSPALEDGVERIQRIAASPLSVLLLGETGTGKEVVARSIHAASLRPGPFVAVNCGAIPGPLMEAQLFGHTKGAFTGAVRDEVGFVRSAHFGTLLLDEIADLLPGSQAALLRVLESGEVTPVGSAKSTHVDVRVLAATHRNIEALMDEGTFRRDLYARLAGFVHRLPPLRDRPEDIGWLIGTLLARRAQKGTTPRIKLEAARALFSYPFPLNVRELEQGLASAQVLSAGEAIALRHLPDAIRAALPVLPPGGRSPPPEKLESAEDRAVRESLVEALKATSGNVSEAARRMGKARQQIQRWLRRFDLDPTRFR